MTKGDIKAFTNYLQLTKPIATMSASRKKVYVGDVEVFGSSLIFSRVLCLQKVRYI